MLNQKRRKKQMRTKKLVAGFVAMATMASLATSAIVTAAEGFGVSISSATAAPGESVELTLDMANIPSTGINGCEFGISYDSSLVTVTDVTLGSLAKDVSTLEPDLPSPLEVNIEDDIISVMYAIGTTDSSYYLSESGTFLNIKVDVKADAAAGKTEFKVVPVDRAVKPGAADTNADVVFGYMAADDSTTTYEPTLTNGVLTISGGDVEPTDEPTDAPTENIPDGTLYGDVNVDGKVNVADVVKINQYLLDPETNPITAEGKANADCERDNKIDMSDAALLTNAAASIVDLSTLGKA
jgi:hypothetical protein